MGIGFLEQGEDAMTRKYAVAVLAAVAVTGFLAGTVFSVQAGDQEKGEVPQPPPPPKELKALEAFVGQWRSSFEFMPAMFPQGGQGTGVGSCEWVLDNRFVMSKGEATSSVGPFEWVWVGTYDPMMQSYRSFEFNSHGEVGIATMSYDANTKTWTSFSDGVDMTGKPAKNKGTMRFLGKDKMEWEWFQKPEGAADFAQMMKGTDVRVPHGK
jgi:hypothetical protein